MRKFISVAAVLAIMLSLSACSSVDDSSSDINSSNSANSDASTNTDTDTNTDSDSSTDANTNTDADTNANSDSSTDELAQIVITSTEWAKMAKVEDADFALEMFKLDLDNPDYDQISIYQCPMSASLSEVIIIKPADGKSDAALNALQERKTKLVDVDTYYPDQKGIAENAIIGQKSGYVYFIADENAEIGEQKLLESLS